MTKLPLVSGKELVGVLGKLGYQEVRRRSSHIRLACFGRKSVTIPDYHQISRGLLRKILRDTELSVEEFANLLKV